MVLDIENIAQNIYSACVAYEEREYEATKENDMKQLQYALECVAGYARYNKHFEVLAECLRAIFDN